MSPKPQKFSANTVKRLGHYVYGLVDPRDNRIFYVGKASENNRAYDHLKADSGESEKHRRIRDIKRVGLEPMIEIMRHGLASKEESFEVEAAIIDAIGLENLTNNVRGHGVRRGRQAAGELERTYGAPPVDIAEFTDPVILFFINQTYSPTKTEVELYDSVRQFWSGIGVARRTPNAAGELPYQIAFGVVAGIVVRAYSIAAWFPAGTTLSTREHIKSGNCWEFVGQLVEHEYVGAQLLDRGRPLMASQQGYRYVN